jgi:hypothetical protein
MRDAAVTLTVFLFVVGAAFIVTGVHFLVGIEWAFIAIGLMLFGAGLVLRAGLMRDGR